MDQYNKQRFNKNFNKDAYKPKLSLEQYAAIILKVPTASEKWLNDMIKQSRRLDIIESVIMGQTSEKNRNSTMLAHQAISDAATIMRANEKHFWKGKQ